jgi:catechol 2,3-dioxygenase-like lactoylglutathione lyase family enzyme
MLTMLEAVHPVLMSGNVAQSIAFYRCMGFDVTFQDDISRPEYAALTRDAVELHLQWKDVVLSVEGDDARPTYRFAVKDVDDLYAEFREAKIVNDHRGASDDPWTSPGDTPWGTREFHVRDPDGNGLQFYQSIS